MRYLPDICQIFARHLLTSRRQQPGESLDKFLQSLRELSKDCNFKPVSSEVIHNESICDAFINGLESNLIRKRLLENKTLDLQAAFKQARSLDLAQKNADSYSHQNSGIAAAINEGRCHAVIQEIPSLLSPTNSVSCTDGPLAAAKSQCWFCGNLRHPRSKCPARDIICYKCSKKGHFAKLCHSSNQPDNPSTHSAAVINSPTLAVTHSAAANLAFRASANVYINGHKLEALIDSGSTDKSFISSKFVQKLKLKHFHARDQSVWQQEPKPVKSKVIVLLIFIFFTGHTQIFAWTFLIIYALISFLVLISKSSTRVEYGGSKPTLTFCALTTLNVEPPMLFANLSKDCKPIATKSRKFSKPDQQFIDSETHRLLAEGIIEPSTSPWRAQPLVVREDGNHKRRMVIDYSQTVNKYTCLDAYPLPNIESTVRKLAQYKFFSTIDLRSAYHQIPLDAKSGHSLLSSLVVSFINLVECHLE